VSAEGELDVQEHDENEEDDDTGELGEDEEDEEAEDDEVDEVDDHGKDEVCDILFCGLRGSGFSGRCRRLLFLSMLDKPDSYPNELHMKHSSSLVQGLGMFFCPPIHRVLAWRFWMFCVGVFSSI
jgi:hypothetical protein